MGLDMYLKRKKYVGAKYTKPQGEINIQINGKKLPIDFNKVSYIIEDAGYWRKANAIHKWFVDKVQDGIDDCKEYDVSIEQLEELLDLCKEVDDNPELANELLPTVDGFFFGSTEYDEYYFEDIKRTIDMLEEILNEEKDYNELDFYSEFTYQSSW